MLNDHNAKPASDPLVSLEQVCDLLGSHPEFRVTQIRPLADLNRKPSRLAQLIKEDRLRRFGAEFANTLALLDFRIDRPEPNTLVLDLTWHITEMYAGSSVFIHFLDSSGAVRFQGDYPFEGEVPDRLGFVYSRRTIDIPREVAPGEYRTRLGVWFPRVRQIVTLTRFYGCDREAPGWYHNAVLLSPFAI